MGLFFISHDEVHPIYTEGTTPQAIINGVVCYGDFSGAQKIIDSGFMDVQRTFLLTLA